MTLQTPTDKEGPSKSSSDKAELIKNADAKAKVNIYNIFGSD